MLGSFPVTVFAYLNFREDAEKILVSGLGLSQISLLSTVVPSRDGAFPDPKGRVPAAQTWTPLQLPASASEGSEYPNTVRPFSCCSLADRTRMLFFRGKL